MKKAISLLRLGNLRTFHSLSLSLDCFRPLPPIPVRKTKLNRDKIRLLGKIKSFKLFFYHHNHHSLLLLTNLLHRCPLMRQFCWDYRLTSSGWRHCRCADLRLGWWTGRRKIHYLQKGHLASKSQTNINENLGARGQTMSLLEISVACLEPWNLVEPSYWLRPRTYHVV